VSGQLDFMSKFHRLAPFGGFAVHKFQLGTCESFFFVRIESRIESAVAYTTQAVTQPNGLQAYRTPRTACYTYSEYLIHRYFVFVTNENDVRTTELRTKYLFTYFNSVIKRVKQCCCTLIVLPKSTLNANLTTTNRFFTNDD